MCPHIKAVGGFCAKHTYMSHAVKNSPGKILKNNWEFKYGQLYESYSYEIPENSLALQGSDSEALKCLKYMEYL